MTCWLILRGYLFKRHRSIDLVPSENGVVLCLSHSKTGFELRNRFYTTDWYTAVCVLVVFSCTVATEVYIFVLLACNSREFRNKVRVLEETFVLDVKKETYDQKHIDDENLDKARHLKKLTVDDV